MENIIIAVDSFKGSLSAYEAANSIEVGLKKIIQPAKIKKIPLSDGGEGSSKILTDLTGGKYINTKVHDPSGKIIKSYFGVLGDGRTAVIELAKASGITLIKEKNPFSASSFGTGELIKTAINKGYRDLIICLGGSATIDCGMGALQALGIRFIDNRGDEIPDFVKNLERLAEIDLSNLIKPVTECRIRLACDVQNPLTGKQGAAFIFAEQKGVKKEDIPILEAKHKHFAEIIRVQFGKDMETIPGTGAAGGFPAGFSGILNAEMINGFELISEFVHLEEKLKTADLIITGEGEIDDQLIFGKVPFGVSKLSRKYNIPIIAFTGDIRTKMDITKYFDKVFRLSSFPYSKQYLMEHAFELLQKLAEKSAEEILILRENRL